MGNYNENIRKIRTFIEKRNYNQAVLRSAELLRDLLTDRFADEYDTLSDKKRKRLEDAFKNFLPSNKSFFEIDLGKLAKIYEKSKLFMETDKLVNVENINKINEIRKRAAHPKEGKEVKKEEAEFAFMVLVNFLLDYSGYPLEKEAYKLH